MHASKPPLTMPIHVLSGFGPFWKLVQRSCIGSLIVMAGCGGGGSPAEAPPLTPTTVTLLAPVASLQVGQTATFTAHVTDQFGNKMSAPVTWVSSTPAVLTIDQNGQVAAVSPGTSSITGTAGTAVSPPVSLLVTQIPAQIIPPPLHEPPLTEPPPDPPNPIPDPQPIPDPPPPPPPPPPTPQPTRNLLPPWLSYCDAAPCNTGAPLTVKLCPDAQPGCTPQRSTVIVTSVDGVAINGASYPITTPTPASLTWLSGPGFVMGLFLNQQQAPYSWLYSELEMSPGFYGTQPAWGTVTHLAFESAKQTTALLESILFRHPSYFVPDLHAQAERIIQDERAMVGITSEPVRAFFIPSEMVAGFGEGNWSYGNGTITVNYGNPPYIAAVGGVANAALPRFAHEYGHELFDQVISNYGYNPRCLNEGVAEAIGYVAGYLDLSELGPIGPRGTDFRNGCLGANGLHETGNCYFWHLQQAGLLTPDFLFRFFRPQFRFSFDSCTFDSVTGNSLLVAFTDASNGANLAPVLTAMRLPHAGNYQAAKAALGL